MSIHTVLKLMCIRLLIIIELVLVNSIPTLREYTLFSLCTSAHTQVLRKSIHLIFYPIKEEFSTASFWNLCPYTEFFFSVALTFALSLTELLSHLGSNICKTQDHSHSDTTPLYYIYISTYGGTG